MDSTNPELNWKTVTKGRRSRKSIARSVKGIAKVGNFTSPNRVGDFSGSDSDKFDEVVLGQSAAGKSESVPIKKRRRLLQSPSSDPLTPLRHQDSASPLTCSPPSLVRGDQTEPECNGVGDFSGIELLAAAASMDDNRDNAIKQDLVAEESLIPKNSDASCFPTQSEVGLKCNETEDATRRKVNRLHWDLNTLMESWDEPYDDSIAGNTMKDINDDMHIEERQKARSNYLLSNPNENPKTEEYEAAGTDASERKSIEISNCDAHMDAYNQVMITDSVLDNFPLTKMSVLMSEEKIGAKIPDEDCSSNVREFESPTRTQDVAAYDMLTSKISESPIDVQCKDIGDFNETPVSPGTFIQGGRPALTADSETQYDGNFVSGSTLTDFQEHAAVSSKHENNNSPNELIRNVTEDSIKSCCAGAQCDDPTASVGKIDLAIDGPPNSNISQNNYVNMVGGDDLIGSHEGYGSPYEDGELRGSFLYSWEDNEMENELIDYESDGRNEDGSEIVEGGSEGSHGTGRSSLLVKGFTQCESTGEPNKLPFRSSVNDDSDYNERAGKGSNPGSGTTVEHSMEMLIDENDDVMKRSQLIDRRDAVDVKSTHRDKFASKMARGKLQSRIEGRSSTGATDGKDGFFMQQCRSRRHGLYSRSERDISPEKYPGRYRPAAHGERNEVQQWPSWGSRRCYTSSYQEPESRIHTRPRIKAGDAAVYLHDPRKTANYLPKDLHRPFMRRSSPVERDDYSGTSRRVPPTRGGIGNYRGRGRYSQRGGRNFRGDFEALPDDAGPPPVRTSRYLSKSERSFSPSCGRSNSRMPLPRRRSRSRSKTGSPRATLGNRRNVSPDFRSTEVRTERTRMPFPKPNFASDYGERGYISPSRGRGVEDHRRNFANNHRSPVKNFFRRNQRFDGVESSGRLQSDEFFRPTMRRGRLSYTSNGGRERKFPESIYDNRRRDDGGSNMRRYRHNNVVNDFEASNLNNEEDDVPREIGG